MILVVWSFDRHLVGKLIRDMLRYMVVMVMVMMVMYLCSRIRWMAKERVTNMMMGGNQMVLVLCWNTQMVMVVNVL